MITMWDLQEAVSKGWTGELYSDEFKARQSAYKDFDHALKHVRKAAQALENMTELADHNGEMTPFQQKDIAKYVADLIICAARLANVAPGAPIDLDKTVIQRLDQKIFPKEKA